MKGHPFPSIRFPALRTPVGGRVPCVWLFVQSCGRPVNRFGGAELDSQPRRPGLGVEGGPQACLPGPVRSGTWSSFPGRCPLVGHPSTPSPSTVRVCNTGTLLPTCEHLALHQGTPEGAWRAGCEGAARVGRLPLSRRFSIVS